MGRTANDSEASRLGNWVNDVLLLNVGNAGEEGDLLFFFLIFLATAWDMWDLSYPVRDRTHVLGIGSSES